MRDYAFADVLEYTAASRSQAINLTAKRVIVPDLLAAVGTGNRRRFSLLNLIEFDIAAELMRFGVEHYGIAQVLRRIRWVIGDPAGSESWAETSYKAGRTRRRLDPRLVTAELRWWQDFSADWLVTPSARPDWDDPDELQARERVREIAASHKDDPLGAMREIRQFLQTWPFVEAGAQLWARFRNRSTRPAHMFLIVWPTLMKHYRQMTDHGVRDMSEANWVFNFADSPTEAAEFLTDSRLVLNLHAIITNLEDVAGELLEDAERERLLVKTPTSGVKDGR